MAVSIWSEDLSTSLMFPRKRMRTMEETVYDVSHETPLLRSLRLHEPDDAILNVINVQNHDDSKWNLNTALKFAVGRPTVVIAKKLIELGADIDSQEGSDWTPLHYAIDAWNTEAVCMLLYYNADVSICCADLCPLFRAIYYKRVDIAEILAYYYFDDSASAQAVILLTKIKCTYALNLDLHHYVYFPNYYRWDKIYYYLLQTPNTADIFKSLCRIFKYDDFDSLENFLRHYIRFCCYTSSEFLDCLFHILESPVVSELVNLHNERVYQFIDCLTIITSLLSYFKESTDQSTRLKVLYTCFSVGFEINIYDLTILYFEYGFGEELNAIIYTANLCCLYRVPYPVLAYNLYYLDAPSHTTFYKYWVHANSQNTKVALKYFTIPPMLKNKLKEKFYDDPLLDQLEALPVVPSLIQLCRDEIRKTLVFTKRYKQSYGYWDAIKKLPLPQTLQAVLLYKKPLY